MNKIWTLFWFRKVLEPVFYGTIQIGRPSNALGCNVKSDVAWGQANGGQSTLYFMTASHVECSSRIKGS